MRLRLKRDAMPWRKKANGARGKRAEKWGLLKDLPIACLKKPEHCLFTYIE